MKMNNEKEKLVGAIDIHKEGYFDRKFLCHHVKVRFANEMRYFCLSRWAHEVGKDEGEDKMKTEE